MPDDFQDEPSTTGTGADGRRQHKYSTKDMKPERPWKRWCFTAICCLLCIAIMILISIYLQKLFDPPEDEDWSDDVVNATDDDVAGTPGELSGAAALLPKNMDYIEDVCSEERLGQDDKAGCQDACAAAVDCCNPFAGGGNSTCFEEQGAGCFSYAKCHSLDGFTDPAHNDLDRICSKAAIEENREECELACSNMACCYMEEESCISTQFQACLDYASCQNLKEDSIDVAPMDLDDRCGKQTPTCKRDCREALCCSDPNSKCYRENFIACLSYSACTGNSDETKITVASIHSRVPAAPTTLNDVCSIKGFTQFGGPNKCLEECTVAQCCWEDGANGCFGDDPLGCLEYQRCTILQQPEYASYTYPPTVAKTQEPAPTPGAAAGGAAAAGGGAAASNAPAETPVPSENLNATSPSVAPLGNETGAGAANAEGR